MLRPMAPPAAIFLIFEGGGPGRTRRFVDPEPRVETSGGGGIPDTVEDVPGASDSDRTRFGAAWVLLGAGATVLEGCVALLWPPVGLAFSRSFLLGGAGAGVLALFLAGAVWGLVCACGSVSGAACALEWAALMLGAPSRRAWLVFAMAFVSSISIHQQEEPAPRVVMDLSSRVKNRPGGSRDRTRVTISRLTRAFWALLDARL